MLIINLRINMITRFTIRIELHLAHEHYIALDSADYMLLHSAMLEQGFSNIVTVDTIEYELPKAEYIRDGIDLSANDIRAAAIKAANKVGKDFTIVVTQSEGKRLYWNLKSVQ